MIFGFRKPSIKECNAAQTSVKPYTRQNLGMKALRGLSLVTDCLVNKIDTKPEGWKMRLIKLIVTTSLLLTIVLSIFRFYPVLA
jgi:hypothetical protein